MKKGEVLRILILREDAEVCVYPCVREFACVGMCVWVQNSVVVEVACLCV